MLSEKEKEAIRVEARSILLNFEKALDTVKTSPSTNGEFTSLRDFSKDSRDSDFRERMFANAPRKMKDCIVAEKASW